MRERGGGDAVCAMPLPLLFYFYGAITLLLAASRHCLFLRAFTFVFTIFYADARYYSLLMTYYADAKERRIERC